MWKRERSERNALDDMMAETTKPYPPAFPPPAAAPVANVVTPPPTPPAAPVAPAVDSPARTAASAAPGSKVSVLGPSLRFKGDLVADEDLVVQGQIEGSILHTRSLTIGAQGRMQGDIKARRITVEGTVDGDLYALDSVVLRCLEKDPDARHPTWGDFSRELTQSYRSLEVPSENISDRLTTAVMTVFARYMTAGPTIMRTELRSFVARDIRSPVRFCWKNDTGSRSRCAKKSFRRSYSKPRDALMMMRRMLYLKYPASPAINITILA